MVCSQTVLVLCAKVFSYLSLIFLLPPQYNGDQWNSIFDAPNIEHNTFNSNSVPVIVDHSEILLCASRLCFPDETEL